MKTKQASTDQSLIIFAGGLAWRELLRRVLAEKRGSTPAGLPAPSGAEGSDVGELQERIYGEEVGK